MTIDLAARSTVIQGESLREIMESIPDAVARRRLAAVEAAPALFDDSGEQDPLNLDYPTPAEIDKETQPERDA